MGKELNFLQSIPFWILLIFTCLRGWGFVWVLDQIIREDSKIRFIVTWLSNDLYAFLTFLVLAFLVFMFSRKDSGMKKFLTSMFGHKK